jgi:hypothetical protein
VTIDDYIRELATREVDRMTYATVITVKLDPNSDFAHRHAVLTEFVIPEVKGLSGFQKATWMNDGNGIGTSVVFFDNEEHAREALTALMPANGPPVISCTVHAVELEF